MSFKSKVSLFFCILIAFSLQAKNVVIKGTAKGFAGREIEVLKDLDFVTHIKKRIAVAFIGKDGKFDIDLNVPQTSYVRLQIEDKSTGIFVDPGKVYNIYLWYDQAANAGHIFDRELSISFPFPRAGSVNQLISLANIQLDKYVSDNKPYIMKQDRRKMVKSFLAFKKDMLSNTLYKQNKYVENYVFYSIATLATALRIITPLHPGEKLKSPDYYYYERYFKNRPVLFNNKEYMHFFGQYFSGRFSATRLKEGIIINGAISMGWSYKKIASYLKKKVIFSNDTIRELFFLNGLDNAYHNKYVDKKNMLKLLKEIEAHPVCEETKKLAQNVYEHITNYKLSEGIKAPPFTLPDANGKMVSLKDFRGKYVYLEFWAAWSIPSVKEMLIIKQYKKKYGDKIAFVSICTDGKRSTMKEFLKIYPFKWTFLHYNYNSVLLSDYFVYTIPTYVLIDPQGNIVSSPAPEPGGVAMHPGVQDINKMFYAIQHGDKL